MLRSVELKQEKAKVWHQAKALHDAAVAESRSMTAEEEASWDRLNEEMDRLAKDIAREETYEAREREHAVPTGNAGGDGSGRAGGSATSGDGDTPPEVRAAFRKYLIGGAQTLSAVEIAALEAGRGDLGGFLVMPQEFVQELIQAVDDQVVIRQLATVRQLAVATSLGVPSLDTDPSDPDWTSEIATGTEDTAMRIGKRELAPHPLAKRIKVSKKLLRQTGDDAESLVRGRLAYKFGVAEEKAFLTGNGVNRPLGLFTASANGISTGRDVVAGSATDLTADGVIDTKFALKGAYWGRSSTRWLIHRDGLKRIRKLKDTTDQYLWAPGLAGGEPDSILDIPYVVSEFAPNTFTTGLYVILLGDISFYWIAEALDMEIQRLVELYAEANQVGFIGRAELDGMPVLEEAFVRGKLA